MRMLKLSCIVWLLFFGLNLYAGTIYYYEDKNGVLHFTDLPESSRYKPYFSYRDSEKVSREEILSLVRQYSRHYGLEPELVQAVLEVESDYKVQAVSRKGAQGLMQIMPETQQDLGLKEPYDPASNIEAGVRYLKKMLNRYSSLKLALAAYNAGPSKVDKYQDIPPYKETDLYVKKVLSLYNRIKYRDGNVQSSQ